MKIVDSAGVSVEWLTMVVVCCVGSRVSNVIKDSMVNYDVLNKRFIHTKSTSTNLQIQIQKIDH